MSSADSSNPGLSSVMDFAGPRVARTASQRRLAAWLLPVAYMAGIFFLSSFQWDMTIPDAVPWRDKGVHFLEYLGLGFLCAHAVSQTWPGRPLPRLMAVGALIATAWGFGDELHQAFVPGRAAEVADVVADALGASVGAVMCAFWIRVAEQWRAQ